MESPSIYDLIIRLKSHVNQLEMTVKFGGPSEICGAIDCADSALQQIRDIVCCDQQIKDEDVIAEWNFTAKTCGIQTCHRTKKRSDQVRSRLRDKEWRDKWTEALYKIPKCPFLTGKNKHGWKANIDWFLRPDSVFKIIEGQYDGGESGPALGDLMSMKRAIDDEIHNHRENRDGPAFRFGRSTQEGRDEFAALKAKRDDITRRISSMNGPE